MVNFNLVNFEFKPDWKWRDLFKKKSQLTKETVKILFVDDLNLPIVDNLGRAGYNVKRIKDIKDVDDLEVKDRHIIFVDFDGVGKNFSQTHQGAALVKAIKDKYGKSKFVVLYTDQTHIPSATSMSDLFMAADSHMKKSSSDTSDFIEKITEGLRHIHQ